MNQCGICKSTSGSEFRVRERMFGTGDEFTYFECADCGCLQLVDVPDDMTRFYPEGYYSLSGDASATKQKLTLRQLIKRRRDLATLFKQGGLFGWLAKRHPNPTIARISDWFSLTGIHALDQPILDVGCGDGQLLGRFAEMGLTNLTGIDPYRKETRTEPGLKLIAGSLEDLNRDRFDLIMLHHTFEHLPAPDRVLSQVASLLGDDGKCVIRIPLKSDGPWKTYGTDWGEIDAPRHLFLYTEDALHRVAEKSGFQIEAVHYEDEPFAYYLSELYRRNQTLASIQQGTQPVWDRVFSEQERERMKTLSRENNVSGKASRAAFILRKT